MRIIANLRLDWFLLVMLIAGKDARVRVPSMNNKLKRDVTNHRMRKPARTVVRETRWAQVPAGRLDPGALYN
jgi:hypothetical protein